MLVGSPIFLLLICSILFHETCFMVLIVPYLGMLLMYLWNGFVLHENFRQQENQKSAWSDFAESHGVSFYPGALTEGSGYISGEYEGHRITIETMTNLKTLFKVQVGSQLKKQAFESDLPADILLPEKVAGILSQTSLSYRFGVKRAKIEDGGDRITYEVVGIVKDPENLGSILAHLTALADGYMPLIACGGGAVPVLRNALLNRYSEFEQPATALIRGISKNTTSQLGYRADRLLCRRCLTSFAANQVSLPGERDVTYYGCRTCSQSREFFEGEVVMVLDQTMTEAQIEANSEMRLNWLANRRLHDFHRVEIIQASDEEIERFAVQIGNDTDDFRRGRYPTMTCMIAAGCTVSENTVRILKSTFGQVQQVATSSGPIAK